jgi:centromere/kinetochore protein ZW10
MGQLVESVVTRLLDEIVALDDITEVESERISSMLGDVELLETLFISANGSSVSSIAVHVPHWLKMCYIKEILHANLVDITYLFESGSLVDFKPPELSKLVQALFADSAKRSALLDKISAAQ